MNRKDEHIRKYLHDPLPEPEIPADDAWAGMEGMLNTGGGHGGQPQGGHSTGLGRLWKSIAKFKGLVSVVSGVMTVAVVTLVVYEQPERTGSNAARDKSLPAFQNQPAIPAKDSLPPGEDDATLLNGTPSSETIPIEENKIDQPDPHEEHETSGGRNATGIETDSSVPTTRPADHAILNAAGKTLNHTSSRKRSRRNALVRTEGANTVSDIPRFASNPGRNRRKSSNAVTENRHTSTINDSGPANPGSGNPSGRIGGTTSGSNFSNAQSAITSQSAVTETGREPGAAKYNPASLLPLPARFTRNSASALRPVTAPVAAVTKAVEMRRGPVVHGFHFGPEWGLNGIDMQAPYLFTGADSVRRLGRLAVPGLFVTKTWNRHGITFVFTPLHSYFASNQRIHRDADSVGIVDSSVVYLYTNTKLIKAVGMNFALQYQYAALDWLSLTAGMSYARLGSALLRTETENYRGQVMQGPLVTVRKTTDFNDYIRRNQWALRAGFVTRHPALLDGRVHIGVDALIPVSNLSKDSAYRVRDLNWRIYLRLLIR